MVTYDDSGRRTGLDLPNGTRASYSYDEAGELIRLSWKDAEDQLLYDSSYTYDQGGRRISEAFGLTADRTSLSNPTLSDASFDAANHVIVADNQEYVYDENGNLIADGDRLYQWDARNRLTSVSQSDGTLLTFKYDALGRRIEKTRSAVAPTSYIYDGDRMLMQLQDGVATSFLDGPRIDEHLAKIDDTASYFVVDGLQSVIGVTNESGAMTAKTSYDAYGASSDDGVASPFGYTGRERDLNDLYYYRARYFSTSQRRFLSEDPIAFGGGDQNLYAYVGGNPLNYTDPLGLVAHYYQTGDVICNVSQAGCTPQNVFNRLRRWPAPFSSGDHMVSTCDQTHIPWLGTVVHEVDESNYSVTNTTLSDHKLYPGAVTRTVTVDGNGIYLYKQQGRAMEGMPLRIRSWLRPFGTGLMGTLLRPGTPPSQVQNSHR